MNKDNNNTPKKQKDKINTKVYTYYTAKEKLQISIEDSGVTEELIAILRELDHEAHNDDRKHDSHKQFENDLFEDLELIDTTQLKALTTNSKFSTIEIEIMKNERVQALYRAINKLENEDKEFIVNLYFNELSEKKLSEIMMVTKSSIHRNKLKILSDLRKIIKLELKIKSQYYGKVNSKYSAKR